MCHSNNTIVRSCFNHAIVNVNSSIGAKLAFLLTLGVDILKHKLYVMLLSKFHKVELKIKIYYPMSIRPINRTCKTVIKYSGTLHKIYI